MFQGYFCGPGSPCHSLYPKGKSNVPAGITPSTAWSRGVEGDRSLGKEGKMLSQDPGHPWGCCPWEQENPELCYKTNVQHLPPCQSSLEFLPSASHTSCRVPLPALAIPGRHRLQWHRDPESPIHPLLWGN